MRILNITIVIILLFFTYALANDFYYPDSNECKYPEYEVTLINNFIIETHKLRTDIYKDRELIEFVINYKYDIDSHKNKLYSIFVINKLAHLLEERTNDNSKNNIIQNFILQHETSNDYSDKNIWNKFIVWIVLRDSINSDDISSDYLSRRIKLLENIIKNNPKYAAISSYLMIEIESIWIKPSNEDVSKGIEALELLIKTYPNSEFAAQCEVSILNKLIVYQKNYDKALIQCQQIITKYNNFFTGMSDLYFDTYAQILKMYKIQDNEEMIKIFLNKLNKNSKGYKSLLQFYTKTIK